MMKQFGWLSVLQGTINIDKVSDLGKDHHEGYGQNFFFNFRQIEAMIIPTNVWDS